MCGTAEVATCEFTGNNWDCLNKVESNIEYARTVFNEMVARNMPVQLLSISIDGVDILDEYRGRCEDAI